jgi:hypothetical protein
MCRQLLCVIVFCLFFTNILSIRCYAIAGDQCLLMPNLDDCGAGQTCQCAKYLFTCTHGDQACNAAEQVLGTPKWAYVVLSQSTCDDLKNPASGASNVECCSTDKCNKPDNVNCIELSLRRRDLRKLAGLYKY